MLRTTLRYSIIAAHQFRIIRDPEEVVKDELKRQTRMHGVITQWDASDDKLSIVYLPQANCALFRVLHSKPFRSLPSYIIPVVTPSEYRANPERKKARLRSSETLIDYSERMKIKGLKKVDAHPWRPLTPEEIVEKTNEFFND